MGLHLVHELSEEALALAVVLGALDLVQEGAHVPVIAPEELEDVGDGGLGGLFGHAHGRGLCSVRACGQPCVQ